MVDLSTDDAAPACCCGHDDDPAPLPRDTESVGVETETESDPERFLVDFPGRVGSKRAEFSAVAGFFGIVGGIKLPVNGSPVMKG